MPRRQLEEAREIEGGIPLRRLVAGISLGSLPALKLAARLGMREVGEVMHAGLRHDLFEVDRQSRF